MNNQQILDALLANSGANDGMHRFASSHGSSNDAALFNLLSQQQQQQQQQSNSQASSSDSNSGLIQALLQHQQHQHQQMQREEQEKALLLQKLKELTNPSPQASPDELAMLLLQQKHQMQNPSSFGMMGSNPLLASNMSANFASASPSQFDAAALSKLLRAQEVGAPSIPTGLSSPMGAGLSNSAVPQGLEMAGLTMPGDRRRKGRTGTFPQKLHQMLSDLERQEGGVEIASFLPHGRAFAIHKPRDFVKHVMPKYFRMSRFSSFQRQLNLYDFQRITEGPDKGSYYHELFVQGRPILSTMMKRNKIKGVKKNKNNDASANTASAMTNVNGAADEDEGDDADDEM